MQLLACVLLLFITTDTTLASSDRGCGGNIRLDQESAGRINITLPGLFTNTPKPMNRQSDRILQLSVCTWMIDVPAGKTVLLKPEWLGGGSSISVHCVWSKKNQVLESGGLAVLSGCDGNTANLTWRGPGHPSHVIQLAYYVQEDERNFSEARWTQQPAQDLASRIQTGTSFPSVASLSQEMSRGTEGGRGHPREDPESSSGTLRPSSGSTPDRGPLIPTSAHQGLPVTGSADRETLPLPEEKANNGADTSGHLTDAPITANERTHPYLLPKLNTGVNSASPRNLIPSTQTADSSDTSFNPDGHTSQDTNKHTTTESDQSVSSSSITPSELTSGSPEERDAIIFSQGVTVVGIAGDKQSHSWRSLQNTDKANADLTPATTSSLLTSFPEPPQSESSSMRADTNTTSSFEDHSRTPSSTEPDIAVTTTKASSDHPTLSQSDSFVLATSAATVQTPVIESSDKFGNTEVLQSLVSASESQTNAPQTTESVTHPLFTSSSFGTQMSSKETESMQRSFISTYRTSTTDALSPDVSWDGGRTSAVTPSVFTTGETLQMKDDARDLEKTPNEKSTLCPAHTLMHDSSSTHPPTPDSLLLSSSSTSSYTLQTHTPFSDGSHTIPTSSVYDSTTHTAFTDHKTTMRHPHTSLTPQTDTRLSIGTSTKLSPSYERSLSAKTTRASLLSLSTSKAERGEKGVNGDKETSTTGPPEPPVVQTTVLPTKQSSSARSSSTLTSTLTWSSTKRPKFYIVPDQPAAIREESIELLLQIVVEESNSALAAGLEEDAAAWMEPYLQRAPGFSRLLGVWSSGHAVQSLVLFKTSGALQWLGVSGPTSLLERTGLAQALRERRTFRSSRITNITVGGLQADVCSWLLQCPAGYKCQFQPGAANYSCSSLCHFDHCHHHGICTHHPGQLPVCHCLVGDNFWYMGKRCDVRMTRARLVGACLAVFVIIVTVIGVLALVAVRRYRAILIQAKVDQTRSSYRRFNHFDELSGRFWLRSWAGSADSLDNPAFTRSDELLHLRALDHPCCYHDDTLSLASTCPSHGARVNTIYPHSSQYGWRGSEMSMGDGVLDSGKASDLSVCSWPVEPIHWTPFPLLQQLASHRTPTVKVSRPRSYCEGMELVDMGRSWTA